MHHRRHALLLGRWMVTDERVVDQGSLARSPLKMPVKPPRSSPADSIGVAIPNIGTLIDYDTVALELVR